MGPAAWIPFILRYWRRARVVNQLSKKRLWLLYSARCLHSRAGTRQHFYKPLYCLKSLVFITAKIKIVHHSLNILICLFFPGYMPNFQSLGLTRNNLLNLLINAVECSSGSTLMSCCRTISIIGLILNGLSVALTSFCVLLSTDVTSVAIVEIFWAASRLLSMSISIAVTKNIDILAFEQQPWWCSCLWMFSIHLMRCKQILLFLKLVKFSVLYN